jgi:2'-5' RNA ligase
LAKNRLRAFVAVGLSPEVRASLADEIARLSASGADVRWVEPGNLHVTLKFLGQVERARVPEILNALEGAARDVRPFRAEVAGVAFFPRPVRPKVVAAGMEEEGVRGLEDLAARVEEALARIGFGRSERRFRAHVTLGRVKSPAGLGALADQLLVSRPERFGEQEFTEVALFISELAREGPRYTVLGRAALGG